MTVIYIEPKYKVLNEVIYVCQWNDKDKKEMGNFTEQEIKLYEPK